MESAVLTISTGWSWNFPRLTSGGFQKRRLPIVIHRSADCSGDQKELQPETRRHLGFQNRPQEELLWKHWSVSNCFFPGLARSLHEESLCAVRDRSNCYEQRKPNYSEPLALRPGSRDGRAVDARSRAGRARYCRERLRVSQIPRCQACQDGA